MGGKPVPSDDVMCRFIKPERGKWNTNLRLPLPRAFKQDDLSVWSKNKLRTQNAEPADLLIDNLAGHAQAYLQGAGISGLRRASRARRGD